jgi:hypothetical protein
LIAGFWVAEVVISMLEELEAVGRERRGLGLWGWRGRGREGGGGGRREKESVWCTKGWVGGGVEMGVVI